MGANTHRAKKALDAMKLLGFSIKQAAPVLKQLLRTFNNNWELIEDECYRVLADAILDAQDNKQVPASSQGAQAAYEDLEPHGTTRDDRRSNASAAEDDNETPLVKRPRMGVADFGQELQPGPRRSTVSTQGALPTSPQTNRRQTRSLTVVQQAADHGDPSTINNAPILKEPKPETQIDAAGVGSTVQNTHEPQQVAPIRNNGVVEVDVASSTNGEVKMSLKCNLDPSKFSISMEEVFKMVEEKCLHSYKVLPPDFSIGKLMCEVCQSVAQLGAMHSDVHRNANDCSLHEEAVAPFVKPIACKAAVSINGNGAAGSSVLESSEPRLQNSIVAWDP